MSMSIEVEGTVADDFRKAFQRLKDGTPTNPELIERLSAGRMRVNIASIAREAGHARRLIAHEKCPYPKVREEILEYLNGDLTELQSTLKQEIARLRNENSELRDTIALLVTANAELVLRVRNAERGARADGSPLKRASKAERLAAVRIVGQNGSALSNKKNGDD